MSLPNSSRPRPRDRLLLYLRLLLRDRDRLRLSPLRTLEVTSYIKSSLKLIKNRRFNQFLSAELKKTIFAPFFQRISETCAGM